MATNLKREGGMVRIEGAQNFDNLHGGLSHLRAIRCVLEYHGEKVDWDWLMGASGEAFCYYYHPDGTFLSQFVHSWDVAMIALGAYGYTATWRSEAGPEVTGALEAIAAEIQGGRPVIAPGMMPTQDAEGTHCKFWFVVTGIDLDAQRVRLLGAGADPAEVDVPPRWFGIMRSFEGIAGHYGPPMADDPILLVRGADVRPAREEIVREGLRSAIALAREQPVVATFGYGAGTYLSGHAALQQLHDDLLAAKGDGFEEFRRLNPVKGDPFRGLGDELEFLQLLSERRASAAKFLAQAAPFLPEAAGPHLVAASTHFESSSAEAMRAFEIRYGSPQELARVGRLALQDEAFETNPVWVAYWQRADEALGDPRKRNAMAGHVALVIESERAAIAEIEDALHAVE